MFLRVLKIIGVIYIIGSIYVLWSLITIHTQEKDDMSPTLHKYEYYTALNPYYVGIKRGDIVSFYTPSNWFGITGHTYGNTKELLTKRIVAKPGDELEITKTAIFVNGHKYLDFDKELAQEEKDKIQPYKQNINGYFVIGDSINNSYDSFLLHRIGRTDKMILPTSTSFKHIIVLQDGKNATNLNLQERKIEKYEILQNLAKFVYKIEN